MGLYVSFSATELGYKPTLTSMVMGQEVSVDVDYGPACAAFCDTFMAEATGRCPVDTGFLKGSIAARTDGEMCEAEATAGYAQYVEYGTWKMAAQSFFTPAVEAGLQAFQGVAGEIKNEAEQELEAMCEEIMEMVKGAVSDGSFLGDMGGIFAGAALLWLLFPVLVNLYGIIDTLDIESNFKNKKEGTIGGTGITIDII